MIRRTAIKYGELSQRHPRAAKIFRYLISGGTAAFTNIFLLYVLTDLVGLWYIAAAVISFCLAFLVSFFLQKYWTFEDVSEVGLTGQAASYFAVAAINLALNTAILYLLVEYIHLHYVLAQIVASASIAIESFFVYQKCIFKKTLRL